MTLFFLPKLLVWVPFCTSLFCSIIPPYSCHADSIHQSYIFFFFNLAFFVVSYAVLFGSQYYLKVCFLTICSPTKPLTLDNMLCLIWWSCATVTWNSAIKTKTKTASKMVENGQQKCTVNPPNHSYILWK